MQDKITVLRQLKTQRYHQHINESVLDKEVLDYLIQLVEDTVSEIKYPESREVLKVEQYQFGAIGLGFDTGWNSCLDTIVQLNK